jgi:hypothetical protein
MPETSSPRSPCRASGRRGRRRRLARLTTGRNRPGAVLVAREPHVCGADAENGWPQRMGRDTTTAPGGLRHLGPGSPDAVRGTRTPLSGARCLLLTGPPGRPGPVAGSRHGHAALPRPHRPAASRHESVPQAGRACRRCRRKAMQPLRPDTRSRPTGEELEEKAGRGRPHLRTPAEKLEACGSPPRTLAALGLGARVACPQGRHASTDRRTASYRVLVAAIWQVPAVRHQRAVGGVGSNGVRTMAKSRRRQAGEGGIRPRPVRAF